MAGEPIEKPALAFRAGNRPVALVLSGGAARGFAHIGVLEVLAARGFTPDLVVGTSAGSVVGALYASGRCADEISAALGELSPSTFRDVVLPNFGLLPGELGVVKGERFRSFIRDRLGHERIEDFPIRFAAVVTDLGSGASHAFNAGDASLAVRASSAVPGVMTPVPLRGRLYADGQISSPVPVAAARRLGGEIVIAVDVIYPPQDALLFTVMDVVFQSFAVSVSRLREHELRGADVVIAPHIPETTRQFGLGERERLVEIGRKAAIEAMPAIEAAMRSKR